ncbi:hypothetical protein [Nitrosopumilus sp.]|uniref:hypothetical protein n=1 Tax=Nitrosopumilus sp. TaxID=2024843 RepID=UPI00292F5AF1|nr:hypothetical protein [Nitrosopumilus sp.]
MDSQKGVELHPSKVVTKKTLPSPLDVRIQTDFVSDYAPMTAKFIPTVSGGVPPYKSAWDLVGVLRLRMY